MFFQYFYSSYIEKSFKKEILNPLNFFRRKKPHYVVFSFLAIHVDIE